MQTTLTKIKTIDFNIRTQSQLIEGENQLDVAFWVEPAVNCKKSTIKAATLMSPNTQTRNKQKFEDGVALQVYVDEPKNQSHMDVALQQI